MKKILRLLVIGIIGIVVICVAVALLSPGTEPSSPDDTQVAEAPDEENKPTSTYILEPTTIPETAEPTEVPVTDTPAPTATEEIEGLVKVGTHLVGTDIEPGIYVGLSGEGILDSCYWARLSNLTGSDDILANDNAQGLFYLEVLVDDRALETGCELLPIEQVPVRDEFLTMLPPGTYLVGRDIEAGTYRGLPGDDILNSCYWARISNVSGDNDILANDNATGQYFIELLPSDFALIVDCELEKIE